MLQAMLLNCSFIVSTLQVKMQFSWGVVNVFTSVMFSGSIIHPSTANVIRCVMPKQRINVVSINDSYLPPPHHHKIWLPYGCQIWIFGEYQFCRFCNIWWHMPIFNNFYKSTQIRHMISKVTGLNLTKFLHGQCSLATDFARCPMLQDFNVFRLANES